MVRDGKKSSGKSFPCNGKLIRFYRERNGQTQAQLAVQAGYSVRLIGKAEAGKPIKMDTIEVLAEALSGNEVFLKPIDLISAPVTLAEKYVGELLRHRQHVVEEIEHFVADDFQLEVVCSNGALPFDGTYAGRAGLKSYVNSFFNLVELPPFTDVASVCSLFPIGNDVIVWYLFHPPLKSELFPASEKKKSISWTSKLVFYDSCLVSQEDRLVVR